jgi:hypothetical protein
MNRPWRCCGTSLIATICIGIGEWITVTKALSGLTNKYVLNLEVLESPHNFLELLTFLCIAHSVPLPFQLVLDGHVVARAPVDEGS